MGSAATYAVLAASTITSSGLTKLTGNMGLSPGASVVGFPIGTLTGVQNIANSAALTAQGALTTARNNAAARVADQLLAPAAGGLTLGVGVYKTTSGLAITGTLTLDCQLKTAPAFIFQIATTFNVANNGKVIFINKLAGATAPKVWWNVGSSATIGSSVTLVGTVLAYQSVSVGSGSTTGPLMGDNGAVTLLTNIVKVGV
jgi:hypothetical protein